MTLFLPTHWFLSCISNAYFFLRVLCGLIIFTTHFKFNGYGSLVRAILKKINKNLFNSVHSLHVLEVSSGKQWWHFTFLASLSPIFPHLTADRTKLQLLTLTWISQSQLEANMKPFMPLKKYNAARQTNKGFRAIISHKKSKQDVCSQQHSIVFIFTVLCSFPSEWRRAGNM